jgi:DNA-binding NtrC family response regulator
VFALYIRNGGQMKIMIIDDETDLLDIYNDLLGSEHNLNLFKDPKDALNHYHNDPDFDYVIVDYVLPHITGEAVIFDIKYVNPNQKIILISGWPETTNFPQNFSVTKMSKPFQTSELIAMLNDESNKKIS